MTIQEILVKLLLAQPFYGHVAASLPMEEGNTATISFSFEHYPRILYNPAWLASLPDVIAVGAIMHQLLHLMLLHPFRRNGRDQALWAIACDMAVNEHIPADMLAKDAVTVPVMRAEVEGLQDLKSAEEYYDILNNSPQKLSLFHTDLAIKAVLSNGAQVKSERIGDNEDSSAYTIIKGLLSDQIRLASREGDPGKALALQIDGVYRSDRLNWRNILKRFITGRGRLTSRKSYRKESKRYEDFPGNKRSSGIDVLVAIDESGSITPSVFRAFYSEVLSIQEITGISMMVTRFDTTCTKPVPARQFALESLRVKSGGTDFRPVFALADTLRIPLLIIFTDGDGPAPASANQKTLWVLSPNGKKPCAFGESVACEFAEGTA
ncbi:MAG: vWA domain-containing protein [Christensenellales bacterium]